MHPASYEVKFYPLNLQIAKQNLKVTSPSKKIAIQIANASSWKCHTTNFLKMNLPFRTEPEPSCPCLFQPKEREFPSAVTTTV